MRDRGRVNRIIMRKIIEYCEQVESLIERFGATFEQFKSDKAFQLSCSMCVVQIGELTKRLSDDFRAEHSDIPWHAIKAMRNVLVHDYEDINLESAWNDLTRSVPELKRQLEEILSAEE